MVTSLIPFHIFWNCFNKCLNPLCIGLFLMKLAICNPTAASFPRCCNTSMVRRAVAWSALARGRPGAWPHSRIGPPITWGPVRRRDKVTRLAAAAAAVCTPVTWYRPRRRRRRRRRRSVASWRPAAATPPPPSRPPHAQVHLRFSPPVTRGLKSCYVGLCWRLLCRRLCNR